MTFMQLNKMLETTQIKPEFAHPCSTWTES